MISKFADILDDQDMRAQIVRSLCRLLYDCAGKLGPMGVMFIGLLSEDMLENKIHEYIVENKKNITFWLQNQDMHRKFADVSREHCLDVMRVPLSHLLQDDYEAQIACVCETLSSQLLVLLRERQTTQALFMMIYDNIETHLEGGAFSLGQVLTDLFGYRGRDKVSAWLKDKGLVLLRSKETAVIISSMLETTLTILLNKPLGKLTNILPIGVRDAVYLSVRRLLSSMLESEVPRLVHSLNIKTIVVDKVNSLDLIQLERHLRSFMEGRLKYIYLFCGLLGFLIGCCSLVILKI